jgi:hypothetical protein
MKQVTTTGFLHSSPVSASRNGTRPNGRISAPAVTKRSTASTVGIMSTLLFPCCCSAMALLTNVVSPGPSDLRNGALTKFDLPHAIFSPSQPSGSGQGHGSKSKWDSSSRDCYSEGGVSQNLPLPDRPFSNHAKAASQPGWKYISPRSAALSCSSRHRASIAARCLCNLTISNAEDRSMPMRRAKSLNRGPRKRWCVRAMLSLSLWRNQ